MKNRCSFLPLPPSFALRATGGIGGTLYHAPPPVPVAPEHLDSASNRNISILILKSFCRCLFHVWLDYSSHPRLPRCRIGKNNTFFPLSWALASWENFITSVKIRSFVLLPEKREGKRKRGRERLVWKVHRARKKPRNGLWSSSDVRCFFPPRSVLQNSP